MSVYIPKGRYDTMRILRASREARASQLAGGFKTKSTGRSKALADRRIRHSIERRFKEWDDWSL